MRPLFLLSLPRSGSTLVQRVLGAHPDVATTAEPWLLLPILYASRTQGARADYWHESAAEAIGDFIAGLDGGREAWHAEVRDFALALYARAGGEGCTYFLDKTPRYHAIATELMEVFEDARFVFLWRDPLAVLASCLETFRANRFEPYHFEIDLYAGLDHLVDAWGRADERAHALRYEDLVGGGEQAWRGLYEFLELDFDRAALEGLSPDRPAGRYGDPTGVERYSDIDAEPVLKWTHSLGGPVRGAWCRRYLRWVGDERMSAMGYDLEGTLAELARAPATVGRAPADAWHLLASRRAARQRARALELPEGPRPLGSAFEPGAP
jgi:hypothetical protein